MVIKKDKKIDAKPKTAPNKKKAVTKCSQDPESFYKALRFQPLSKSKGKAKNKLWMRNSKTKPTKESQTTNSKNKYVFNSKDFSKFLKD